VLPRRIATFLLGAWIGCSILILVIVLQNPSEAGLVVSAPVDGARALIEKMGAGEAQMLLRHFSNEQSRAFLANWELAQMVLTLVMLVTLILSGQRWALPVILTVVMLIVVLVQHFGITPDLLFYGRQADFVRQEASFSLDSQIWTLTRAYGALEAVKLLCGGVMASYFFMSQSSTRVRKRRRSTEEADLHSAA